MVKTTASEAAKNKPLRTIIIDQISAKQRYFIRIKCGILEFMAVEIELKAHVSDMRAAKERFDRIAGKAGAVEKDDVYWKGPPGTKIPETGVRIRKERKNQCETILATYKVKEVREGIEVNDEKEFSVSDDKPFRELLERAGFQPDLWKHKEGWTWTQSGKDGAMTIELCAVKGRHPEGPGELDLGTFAELEILADNKKPETVAAARTRLLDTLTRAGIREDQIEERYYSEMLKSPLDTPSNFHYKK
jgi:adenylate cyclase class 2